MSRNETEVDEGFEELAASTEESQWLQLENIVKIFVHSCGCKKSDCEFESCSRMKRVLIHVKTCPIRSRRACEVCKQFVALFVCHAKKCAESECSVPFCANIKNRMERQEVHEDAHVQLDDGYGV